ncbi:MAG: hypothetical protein GWP14_06235 [Actinobacteria bacterium]|nr:hypothetical protein [Actinomycetota bacterium]
MTTARVSHPKGAKAVLSKLKRMYGAPKPPAEVNPVEQIVLAILAYNESLSTAQSILEKLKSYYVDFNEMRVTQPGELAGHIGAISKQTLPKARRILLVLKSIFDRENTFDLTFLQAKSKRELETYFEQIQGTDNYLIASVILHCCGRQSFPLDDKMLKACKELGLVQGEVSLEGMQTYLERQLKSADSYAFCDLLKKYSSQETARSKTPIKKKASTKKKKAKAAKSKSKSTARRKSTTPRGPARAKAKK